MAYQVIARKWRPQTFDEVTGQEPITRTLRNAIEHQRLHHAYLFSGSRGVGKTTTARILAKALNCHTSDKPTPTPCDTSLDTACKSCREISEGRSNDVREIDAASNTGVENVRSIIDSVGIGAAAWEGRSRYKVFIIDEVHMLSGAAFNALLKTIEEPPPNVVFIMATTELHKVPATIQSRCQQFEFRAIPIAKTVERLKLIAKSEQISIPDDALREIARSGEGSMRDAQSALDQVISFAGTKIEKTDVEMALGIAGADILRRIMDSIAANKAADAIAVVDDIVMRGHDLRNFCRDLLAHFRDLLVSKVAGNAELLESAVCEPEELKRQAAMFTEADLVRFFHSLSETETKLRAATQPRYQLEVGIVKLMELRGVESISEILLKLNSLQSTPQTNPEPVSSQPAGELDKIKAVLEKQRKMLLITALDAAQSALLENGVLHAQFAPDSRHFHATLSKPENMKFLSDTCREVTGREIELRIVLNEPRAAAAAVVSAEDEARRDPAVQQWVKTLRGEIVDVRPNSAD